MEHSSKPPSRPRYAAMRDDQERDDQGERALDEQGVKFSQRPKPPRQVRDSRRASEPRRDRPSTRPDPRSSRRRRHSRDRSRDRAPRPSPDPSRRGPEVNDLIPRYRERHRETDDKLRRRSRIERSPEGIEVPGQEQGTTALNLPQGSTLGTPHVDGVKRRLAITYGHQNPQCDHVTDPRQNQNQVPGVQIEKEGLGNSHRVDHLCQSIEHLRRGELNHYLMMVNVSQTSSNSPRGDNVCQDHLTLAKNGDLERDRLAGAILRGNDSYAQSPQNSYHNSPSRSPYGSSRGGRNGQQPHPQGSNYGPPSGPSSQYHSNPSRSPPHSAPTGPMQQYPQGGSYRGGYRGGGFRGSSFGNRGRGGFKNSHWNQGPPQRGHHDDLGNGRFSNVDEPNAMDIDRMDDGDGSYQTHDRNAEDGADVMTTPHRPPPTGPGSQSQSGGSGSKFSFAFKPSSKPALTAPKPEISQKLNAAPRRDAQKDSRDNDRDRGRDHDRERDRDREREKGRERDRDREPPRSAPTEPASSRSRHDRRQPPEGPRAAPRMRKVKKMMKRPKPRPTLPADLVDSESVFFRKPGNESVVGSGTYGKVFKGLNVYTKGMVALKKIRMEGERDGFPVTAVREIKLLQSLRHVNIVNLQEVMVEKNDCFMVFEYLSHDLTGLLNHPTFKLEAAQKKDLAKQMFEGLDYLHTRGVLHRDIKAANILVSNEGVLKIADFGLARFYAKRHQLDYTNRVITIWYRSPELLLGETKYTAAVDVWSAACVMVEIFDRNAIFPGDGTELNQLEKVYNVMGTPSLKDWPGLVEMPWFELMRPTVKKKNIFEEKYREKMSPAAFELLSAMFHYDPVKRPSAAEVLQHTYFTEEEPPARQATELSTHNDWHEFESKALRKENDRREREARKLAKEGASRDADKDKDKKRVNEGVDQPDAKRLQVDKNGGNKPAPEATSSKPTEA
ncbi:cmgc cdk crk7 kinase [Fusarium sporotrichioides]|uniref:cyclin-dependent kinase n=1 Tax=Fusarium sporotrichioides TaxID=5514 RepID=A0A395SAT3_FUSSP|nr:cmgc cdk crk7 kinase [Fusarium sporotrichioides]